MPSGPATFGSLLRQHRIAAGLTQDQLCQITGTAQSSLSQWETDTTEPTLRSAALIAAALDVSLDVLATPFQPRPRSRRRPQLLEVAS